MTGSWGRWGTDDEAGALNLVTEEGTRRAIALVRHGRTLSLAQSLGPGTPQPPHRGKPARFMNRDAGDYALGARSPAGFKFAEDTVQFPTHSATHVDALAHAWSGQQLYNGHPEGSTRTTRGAQRCGADKLRPVVTRGVLADMVTATGTPLPSRHRIRVTDLERVLAAAGVAIRPGDVVLIRTGWLESMSGERGYFADEPGIDEDAARWLAEQDVAIVGADNYAVECQEPGQGFPAHLVLIHQFGVPLIENLVLAELGAALAVEGRYEFLFAFAPIPLEGSTAAPVNPVVVL